jgi:hypothetical protein
MCENSYIYQLCLPAGLAKSTHLPAFSKLVIHHTHCSTPWLLSDFEHTCECDTIKIWEAKSQVYVNDLSDSDSDSLSRSLIMYADPRITTIDSSLLPTPPEGWRYVALKDPDTLDPESCYPVLLFGPYTYTGKQPSLTRIIQLCLRVTIV